ncbi:MAG: division/cell wall cluster transcriptional repressor MraZ, partial [Clostridia bacterium]|nr:division/cell wall cluster transcriptional repressor MraZ [Clostridia bacterium]
MERSVSKWSKNGGFYHNGITKGGAEMFGGEYRHSLDTKNRIFIPAKLREELGETFVVAKDIREKCLKVYSLEGWESYIAPLRAQARKLSEKIIRFLHASLAQVTPDSQGRIVLPAELVRYANIERNVVIIGCCDYAEIWAETSYEKLKEEEDLSAILEELESL